MRIGYGEDIHRLVKKRKLILGGVEIPFKYGLLGHSDADVVVHSICDAILGALGKRDIGFFYPDTDKKYEGINSLLLLKDVIGKMKDEGFKISNVDISICCEKPRLSCYIPQITDSLSKCMGINLHSIAVKAMSNEGLDAIGKGKAIRSICVVLLEEDKHE